MQTYQHKLKKEGKKSDSKRKAINNRESKGKQIQNQHNIQYKEKKNTHKEKPIYQK